jgi:GxxExxY protein
MGYEFEPLSGRIIEAAIAVHRELGPGFLESVYEQALRVAMAHRQIAYESQKEVQVFFEGEEVGTHRLDLLVGGEIVVEIKAVKALEDIHFAQVRSYLKATRRRVGLLLNFNAPALVVKRVVLGDGTRIAEGITKARKGESAKRSREEG